MAARSAQVVAISCIVGEMMFSTVSHVLLRTAAIALSPPEALFLRLLFAAVLVTPWVAADRRLRPGRYQPMTDRSRLLRYAVCGGVSYLASMAWLYAMIALPLAMATSLFFTTGLFAGLYAWWLLKEPFQRRSWLALAVGLCGVLIVLRPTAGEVRVDGVAAALLAAALAALTITQLRMLRGRETPTLSALLRLAPAIPLAALPALKVWEWPSHTALAGIFVAAALLVLGQAAAAAAFGTLRLQQAAALEYLRLIFATIAGVLVFNETIGAATLLGGAMILCAAWIGSRATAGTSSVAPPGTH
ncbi:DMT family transporter [Steroidobacter sp. S1-65]|uniref:DMT family transporter n=1 Tax=Steroidobacter gossypii TaxID=2805490 RepID=A0ABS1WYB2_9GAMM|nr:DMT family transporter [Steroidobacter gossypii]